METCLITLNVNVCFQFMLHMVIVNKSECIFVLVCLSYNIVTLLLGVTNNSGVWIG
jgi:hypothetical protein